MVSILSYWYPFRLLFISNVTDPILTLGTSLAAAPYMDPDICFSVELLLVSCLLTKHTGWTRANFARTSGLAIDKLSD